MNRKLISSGSEFESKFAYSRAVVDGDYVFVAGTTGYDYRAMTISDDPVEQAKQYRGDRERERKGTARINFCLQKINNCYNTELFRVVPASGMSTE